VRFLAIRVEHQFSTFTQTVAPIRRPLNGSVNINIAFDVEKLKAIKCLLSFRNLL
jgi:hypothetical protein